MLLFGSRVRHWGSRNVETAPVRDCVTFVLSRGVRTRNQPLPVETADFTLKPITPRGRRPPRLRAAVKSPKAHVPSAALHIVVILAPFLALPLAGWVGRRRFGSLLLAAVPAALTGYFAYTFSVVSRSGPFSVTGTWAPALNLSLSFRFDGLSTLFAMLITGVGTLIVIYARKYLEHHPYAGRFHVALFAFMGSMLGVVLSDNVIALFVFWELTGFTSYLLIGFEHERPEARRAATQALLVTGGGGLALLAAGLLLVDAAGTALLSEHGSSWTAHAIIRSTSGIVALVLLAAFTKSAQFPFHFWLPNAMQAPTPVSAYLHSATMVKAGVYLVARMTPLLGGTTMWTGTITVVAALTMMIGALRALLETDLKRVLAYSTISALGHSDAAVRRSARQRRSRPASPICSPMPATRARCFWSPARSSTRPARETSHGSEACVARCR